MAIRPLSRADFYRWQPDDFVPINQDTTLTDALVFACYPVDGGFVDVISKQFVSNITNRTQHIMQTPDGNQSTSTYVTSSSALQFTKQTGLDLIDGTKGLTIFADACEGLNGTEGTIFRSYDTGTGYGVTLRFDDGTTAIDSFNIYTGNSVNGTYYNLGIGAPNHALVGGVVTNGNSWKFAKRFAITMDASANLNWYASRKLKQTKPWGANRLPQAQANRRTAICNNVNHRLNVMLGFNRVLTLDEYCQLYDNPWQIFQQTPKVFRLVVPGAGLTGISGTGTLGTASPGITVPIFGVSASTGVGKVYPSSPDGAALESQSATTAIGNVGANITITLGGNAAAGALGTVPVSTVVSPIGNPAYSNQMTIVSFGQGGTYHENDDGVGSAALATGGAKFVASISGPTMTVSSVIFGTVASGYALQSFLGSAVAAGTTIVSGSGSTWTVSPSQTVSSQTLVSGALKFNSICYSDTTTFVQMLHQAGYILTTGTVGAGQNGYAQGSATCLPTQITGSLSGTSLVVSTNPFGDIVVGQQLAFGDTSVAGPVQITGGSASPYTVTNPSNVSFGSGTAMTLSKHGGLSYPGQYFLPTNKGAVGTTGLFCDAQLSGNATSALTSFSRPDGAAFTLFACDVGPNPKPNTNGNCYVLFTAYTGTPVSVANNAIVTTGATQVAQAWVNNTTTNQQTYQLQNANFLSGSSFANITSFVIQAYGFTKGNIVNGFASNDPNYVFDYIQIQPVIGNAILGPSNVVAQTGNSASSAEGLFAAGTSVGVTGLAATGAEGTTAGGQPLVGNSASTATGTVSPNLTVNATGSNATTGTGSMAVSILAALFGSSGTGSTGNLLAGITIGATGNSASSAVGGMSPGTNPTLVGITAAGAEGTTPPSSLIGILGVSGSGDIGTMHLGAVQLSGVSASTATGVMVPSIIVSPAGNAATGAEGVMSVSILTGITGSSGSGATGLTFAGNSPALVGNSGSGAVGSSVVSFSVGMSGNAGSGTVGFLATPGPPLHGNSAFTATGFMTASIRYAFVDGNTSVWYVDARN